MAAIVAIRMILASFDLQVTLMIPTKFQVNWPFGSKEEAKIDFQDGHHGGHFGFPIETILAIFDLQVTRIVPTKFRVNWHSVQEEKGKIDMVAILDFRSEQI